MGLFNFLSKYRMNRHEFAYDSYKRAWLLEHNHSLNTLLVPQINGLVSIILPVYNGEDYLSESIESILKQTYPHFELIAVNDGSQDSTANILDAYAARDPRIKVIHKNNQKLPAALNTGFHAARGEFHTWTSHDNRLKPNFLEEMVACLQRHPDWDGIYSNLDIIGTDGAPLIQSEWYQGYQTPPGSEHIYLPEHTAMLNTYPNNFIGASFMYRARATWLLGDYSQNWFTLEDYDYWMRMNNVLTLRHTDFDKPLYEYRFHPKTLTAQDKELKITERRKYLFAIESFRRDHYLSPTGFHIQAGASSAAQEFEAKLRQELNTRSFVEHSEQDLHLLPETWLPIANIVIADRLDQLDSARIYSSPSIQNTLLWLGDALPEAGAIAEQWNLLIWNSDQPVPRLASKTALGWFGVSNLACLIDAIDIRAKNFALDFFEKKLFYPQPTTLKASVIITSYRRANLIPAVLTSLAQQTLSHALFEVIVVNNDPDDVTVAVLTDEIRSNHFSDNPDHLRYVTCRVPGLSNARNTGLCQANGEIIAFIDDDAIAEPDWLEKILEVFEKDSDIALVGGKIILAPPSPRPAILHPGWEHLWSQNTVPFQEPAEIKVWWQYPWGCNWNARRSALWSIGGFRRRYGRTKKDFSGGEEVVAAALIQSLGHKIYMTPHAVVYHQVERDRYTFKHVWKTILSGQMTGYLAQKELYLPFFESIPFNLIQIIKNTAKTLLWLSPFSFKPYLAYLAILSIVTRFVLLKYQIVEFFMRFEENVLKK